MGSVTCGQNDILFSGHGHKESLEYGRMCIIERQAARIKDYGLTVKIKTYYDLSVTGSIFKWFLQSYPQIYPQPK